MSRALRLTEAQLARRTGTQPPPRRKAQRKVEVLPNEGTGGQTFAVHIPGFHPARVNQLIKLHYLAASRRKKADAAVILDACRSYGVTRAIGKRRVWLLITLAPRQRAADPDAYWKSLLDALVSIGALVDDNRQHVELAPVEFERGEAASTTITLTDIALASTTSPRSAAQYGRRGPRTPSAVSSRGEP